MHGQLSLHYHLCFFKYPLTDNIPKPHCMIFFLRRERISVNKLVFQKSSHRHVRTLSFLEIDKKKIGNSYKKLCVTFLNALLTYLIITTTLWGKYHYYSQIIDSRSGAPNSSCAWSLWTLVHRSPHIPSQNHTLSANHNKIR